MATKFRKDNAMAFLMRSNAKPVSLLNPIINKTITHQETAAAVPGADGGLKVGKMILLRAADSKSQNFVESYIMEVVATHIVSSLSLSTTSLERLQEFKRPHCAVKWIVCPGERPLQLASLVSILEKMLLKRVGELIGVFTTEAVEKEVARRILYSNSKLGQEASSQNASEILQNLLLQCLACLDISHPADAGSFVKSIATCNMSSLSSVPSSGTPTPSTSLSKGSDQSAVPLLILTGLGYLESYLQCLEKQVGCEVPLRWALETFFQAQHAAVIVSESLRFRAGSENVPATLDLRRDSYLVQNLTSRGAFAVVNGGCWERFGSPYGKKTQKDKESDATRTRIVSEKLTVMLNPDDTLESPSNTPSSVLVPSQPIKGYSVEQFSYATASSSVLSTLTSTLVFSRTSDDALRSSVTVFNITRDVSTTSGGHGASSIVSTPHATVSLTLTS